MKPFWPVEIDEMKVVPWGQLSIGADFDTSRLDEVAFDTTDIKLHKLSNDVYFSDFTSTEKNYYRVAFGRHDDDVWEITLRYDETKPSFTNINDYISSLNLNKNYTQTKSNIPFKVLSFVISSVISFNKEVNPPVLYFYANYRRADKTYQLLAKNISKKIGWKLVDGMQGLIYRAFLINPEKESKYRAFLINQEKESKI